LLPGFDMVGWFAVVAPSGAPQDAIARVNRDLSALLADKDVAERMAVIGPIAEPGLSVEQVGAFLRSEHQRWAQIVKEIGVLPE
jgi:tripartite-type tricarboxylate transporter receptor subunit TctC